MRHFIHLAYQGTKYRGWQRQANERSVQATIEDLLSKMLKTKTIIHGCGRTDAGVNASQYFVHADIPEDLDYDPVKRLNHMLPDDIAIYEIIPIHDPHCNAQTDAIARSYEYYMHFHKIPQLKDTSTYFKVSNLDVEAMQSAVIILQNTKDFRSLCKSPDIYKHTRCNVQSVSLEETHDGNRMLFSITANRFLRAMIRNIVARLINIGKGELSLNEFTEIIRNQKEFEFPFHKQAPPTGLYLSKIIYPYLERDVIG